MEHCKARNQKHSDVCATRVYREVQWIREKRVENVFNIKTSIGICSSLIWFSKKVFLMKFTCTCAYFSQQL